MKKITIELSNYEYIDLAEKAKKADIKIEKYIKQIRKDNRKLHRQSTNQQNKTQQGAELSTFGVS